MPPILKRSERQAQTREELLRAAAVVFERDGFHGSRLDAVAAEAGVTTGAVYSNFSGKDELFLELAERQIADRLEQIRAVADSAAAAAGGRRAIDEEVAAQFAAFFEGSSAYPLLFHEFWTYAARRPELRERFAAHRETLRDAIAEAIVAGAEARGRELTMDPAIVASVVRATLNGLAFERVMDGNDLPLEATGWAIGSLIRSASRPQDEGTGASGERTR